MSALTSLLVRDDAVSVRQIEEALARQVVDGGELDTALLELAALPENKLIAYRAASERGQPATREQVMSASSAARALLPGELAIALQVSPLSHEDKTLTVAAVRTLKPSEIAQLAERTGMQIQVRITLELRLLAALERFYGHALMPRHAVLLNRVDAQSPGELVSVEPMQAAVSRASMKTEQLPAFEEAEDFQAVLAAAFERASMSPHAGTPSVDPDETRPLSAKRAFETQKRRTRPPEETAKLGSGMIQARSAQSSVRMSTVAKTQGPSESVEALQVPARGPAPSPVQVQPKAARSELQPGATQRGSQSNAARSELQPGAAQRGSQSNAARSESQPNAARSALQSNAARSELQPGAARSELQPGAARSELQPGAARAALQPGAAWSEPQSNAAGSESQSNAAGSESQSNAAGSESQSNAAGSESQSNAAGSESQSNAAGSESQSNAAGSESQSNAARSESQSNAAGSELQPNAAGSELQSESAQSELKANAARPELQSKAAPFEAQSKSVQSESQAAYSESQARAAQAESQSRAAYSESQPRAAASDQRSRAAYSESQARAARSEAELEAAYSESQPRATQSDPRSKSAYFESQSQAAYSESRSRAGQAVAQSQAGHAAVPKLSMADAQGALSTVEDRDAVLDIYFRYARQMFDATVLFTLKDGRALGAHAHNIKSASDIRDVSSPVARGSALEELTRTLLPRVMDLGRKDEDRALVTGIKRLDSQPAALVPICIKRRVVAVLYGDRGGEPLHLDQLTDLLTLMPHVTVAFERIIRARKALGLTGTPSHIGELSHAPTQRSMPAVQGVNTEARTTDLGERAMVEALKIPQALPVTKGFGLPDDDGDIYATARIPIQPLPLDQFDSPPRYLSKPPPGTGRYQSVAPKGPGAEEVLRPPSTPSELREERTSNSRRPPPRSDASATSEARRDQPRFASASSSPRRPSNFPPAERRSSAVPPAPNARRSMAPPTNNSASSHPALAAPKPAPGSGVYSSQVGTTELINMPPVSAGTPASQDTAYTSRAPLAQSPANQNEGGARGARVSSLPPKAAPETNQVTQLIDALCRSEPNEDPPAIKQLVALGEPALTALLARFPGPLWFDRRKPHARLPLGRDISPICRALDAFGDQASERLGPVMGSNMTEVRYYATLLAGDRVRPSLLEPMLTRLFDDDPQIRLLVRDALPHYRKFQGFERITERICERARAESAPLYERLAAIDAISVLRDAGCVSTLIDLVGHRDKQICVPAHRALTLITCQDFGKTPRKWRSWLSNNAERHRVEWLIEGLMHSEEPMRATAGLELQKLTQVYYGYVAAASKREREAAQKRYAEWWRTEGRTRIAT